MSTEHEQWARHLAVTGDWDFGVDIAVTANLHHLKLSAPQGKIPRQNSVWRHNVLPVNNAVGRDGFTINREVCGKGFPKAFCPETNLTHNFPVYRRRDSGRTIKKVDTEYTNQWVVPTNKYLILRYNAHINVELCCTSAKV